DSCPLLICYNITYKRRAPMSVRLRVLLAASVSTLVLAGDIGPGHAQDEQLPEIVVTAPSPIVRRRQPSAPGPAEPAEPAAPSPPLIAEAPPPGTLPIVTDQFATVTVVPSEELRRRGGATLGDILFDKPGITGSSFAPGASSRPIIRGLDTNRVGI